MRDLHSQRRCDRNRTRKGWHPRSPSHLRRPGSPHGRGQPRSPRPRHSPRPRRRQRLTSRGERAAQAASHASTGGAADVGDARRNRHDVEAHGELNKLYARTIVLGVPVALAFGPRYWFYVWEGWPAVVPPSTICFSSIGLAKWLVPRLQLSADWMDETASVKSEARSIPQTGELELAAIDSIISDSFGIERFSDVDSNQMGEPASTTC